LGDVVARIKVMPVGIETDLDALTGRIMTVEIDGIKITGVEKKPIAFGLQALMVTVMLGDQEGGTEPIEEALSGLKEVESVQVTDLGRLF